MTNFLILIIVVSAVCYFWFKSKSKLQEIPIDILPDSFIVFDLETTGLKSETNEIIEIAAIRYKKGTTTHDTIQSLVKPKKPVPQKITEITGITQAMVEAKGRPIDEVLEDFRNFIGDLRLVAFNSDFDMAFLQAAAAKAGKPAFNNPVSCALKMARRAWPKRKSFKLDDLSKDGSINQGKSHRALEDSRRALIVYAAAAAQLKSIS
jgi:DNA polymerase III subunit epsilon